MAHSEIVTPSSRTSESNSVYATPAEMPRPYPVWMSRAVYGLMILAVLIRIFYWRYTDRTWEDALISVLHSENAALGLGLTHLQPAGQPPLHGFTSPLSVLIPLVGDLVHVGWGLPFLKLVSVFAGAVAVWFGVRISMILNLPTVAALVVGAYLAVEHQQIYWGMAGMETEVVTVAYLLSIYALLRGTQLQKGLSLGFTMLARPDAAIWVGMAFLIEIWRARKTNAWRALLPVISGLVLLYGPWLVFTFLYYGSPVPNTIIAKSLGYPPALTFSGHLGRLFRELLQRFTTIFGGLGPAYGSPGTLTPLWDHYAIAWFMVVLFLIGLVVALRKRLPEVLLVYSFVVVYALYLAFCPSWIAGWYTAPVLGVAIIGTMFGLSQASTMFAADATRKAFIGCVAVAYVLSLVSVLPFTFRSDKAIQQYVEGNRRQAGVFLGNVSLPNDTIGSESLGYIGYYSRRVIYDYPGLCSRDVVRYLRAHPDPRDHNLISMLATLRPTYLVLRPGEYRDAQGKIRFPWIQQDYELVRVFRVPDEARSKILHSEISSDFEFDIFRKKGAPSRQVDPNPAT